MAHLHHEGHLIGRTGWLRAAVLGANDGILSTASLIMGVSAATTTHATILVSGVAAVVAGAMSMAAGEYVSVSSQADAENADKAREAAELHADPAGELRELTAIWHARGLDEATARRVAEQLTRHDALGSHLRDELGLTEAGAARPVQAALASMAAFAAGGVVPLLAAVVAPIAALNWIVPVVTLALLMVLGAVGARAGGAPIGRGTARVTFWGVLAMAASYAIGHLVGGAV